MMMRPFLLGKNLSDIPNFDIAWEFHLFTSEN